MTASNPSAIADHSVHDAAAVQSADHNPPIEVIPFIPSSNAEPAAADRFADVMAGCLNPLEQESVINLALDVLKRRNARGEAITNPKEMARFFQVRLAETKNEVFVIAFLDNRHRMITWETMFNGTIDGASVYPRAVVARALEVNAAAAVVCHNHPSGVAEPSQSDRRITERLKEALALVDVRMLDHIVVSFETTVSFAESGLL